METTNMDLKWKLLTEFGASQGVDFCKDAYKFLKEDELRDNLQLESLKIDRNTVTKADLYEISLKDGVYLVYSDGHIELFDGNNSKTNAENVAFKFGPVALKIYDHDFVNVNMKCKSDQESVCEYAERYSEAVTFYDGEKATKDLIARGLSFANKIPNGWFVPAFGQMYVEYALKNRINKALEYLGQEILDDVCYWSSTELSVTYTWYMNFYDGGFNYDDKTDKNLVRVVSAFNPLLH